MRSHRQLFSPVLVILLTLSWLAIPATSHAKKKPFDRIVVFGTSLSDSGNAFVLNSDPAAFADMADLENCDLGVSQNVPPYDALDEWLIPDGVYARGGHHVTNGATWIEQYARGQGLAGTTRPALRSSGTKASNYAVGGARSYAYPCRFNLLDQLAVYQEDFKKTSSKTLVVIEMGSNDVRDAIAESRLEILQTTLTNIATTIQTLYDRGARNFLVVNIPALDKTPAILQIDAQMPGTAWYTEQIVLELNSQLAQVLEGLRGYPQITIKELDIYSLLNDIVAQPGDYGITNTDTPCITPNIPPYTCARPDTYLFWDGIHPTKAVHAIVAQEAYELLRK